MEFNEKVTAAQRLLESKGIPRRLYAPTFVSRLWRAGIEVPPPHFASFIGVFLFAAVLFGVVWGVIMWLVVWLREPAPLSTELGVIALVAIGFGLIAATYYRVAARKYGIPRWRDYNG